MSCPVSSGPGIGERVAGHHLPNLGSNKAFDPAGQRLGQRIQLICDERRQPALSERVNKDYLDLSFNYKYDEPSDPNRFFFRSDHYNYAKKGVPIIFYFDGVHEDYHRPSDSVEKIDFQKMERVARTVFATAAELANAPARPRVDKQLPQELNRQ